jgi:peptidylamidoglycolate lyase
MFSIPIFEKERRQIDLETVTAVIFACLVLAGSAANAQGVPESHAIDVDWPSSGPAGHAERCQICGVALDNDGKVFVLGRGENHWMPEAGFNRRKIKQDAVQVFSSDTGEPTESWGRGVFMMPHQIVVDTAGHVWVVDAGLHQVMKFNSSGKRVLVVGGQKVRFNMPTDVAFLSDGSFVVSDGYVNSRIVKFDAEGHPVAAWGTKGGQPLQFQTPHSVAVDDQDRIYVADRENNRIQVVSPQGEYLAAWTNVDRPITVRFAAESLFVLSNLEADKGVVRRLSLDGRVLESFHTKPSGSTDDFEWPHGLAVSGDGDDVYVGFTLTGRRVQRYRRIGTNR